MENRSSEGGDSLRAAEVGIAQQLDIASTEKAPSAACQPKLARPIRSGLAVRAKHIVVTLPVLSCLQEGSDAD